MRPALGSAGLFGLSVICVSRSLAAVVASISLAAGLAACGSSGPPRSAQQTLDQFLRASAAGDGARACALLSTQAQGEVATGSACEDGVKAGASVYGSIIKQIRVTDLKVAGRSATGTSTLNGQPTARFTLSRSSGQWLITEERRLAVALPSDGGGPSEVHVESVAGCLNGHVGSVDNGGLDATGGAHVVLSVGAGGQPSAEIDVFATAMSALSGYKAIKALDAGLPTKLASTSVVVYFKPLSASKRRVIEACA
jgi:hypothetical protein